MDNFYPRSPCGERPLICPPHGIVLHISIHALLAESDYWPCVPLVGRAHFYPRSPCGERPVPQTSYLLPSSFLSTLSLRRATCGCSVRCRYWAYFYPRSPCGERHVVSSAGTMGKSNKAMSGLRHKCASFCINVSILFTLAENPMISVDKIPYQRQINQKSGSKTHDRHKTPELIINVR